MIGRDQYEVQLLRDQPRKDFNCGVDALDRYLMQQAGQDLKRKVTVPYVLVETATGKVAGIYTLSAGSITGDSLSEAVRRKLPGYQAFPIVLLGRLAVDQRYQGRGLGGLLLVDAILRCVQLREEIDILAVVVEAKGDAARSFYEAFGFERFADQEYHLYLPIAKAKSLRP